MSDEQRALLWVVNELLSRFGNTFSIADNGYTFELLALPGAETASQAVACYVENAGGASEGCNWHPHIEALERGEADVHEALACWMKTPFWHLDHTFSQIQGHSPLADLVVECLHKLGVTHCWRVGISKPEGEFLKPFYECSWDDFLLQTPDGFLFLHLGVSD
ncbi:hypothetical protein IAD21_02025 [Abditibacteriota bacterium]|nr:hypothetical protein IAD21_02025 [Abditibacteriota bacterium]